MSLIIDEKRILNNFYDVKENPIQKTDETSNTNDFSSLSLAVSNLKNLPLNLSKSSVIEEGSNYSFNFTFSESRFQNITASGYYSSKEKNLSVNLKFILEKELYENNQKTTKRYQVEVSISASSLEMQSLNSGVQKEDIYNFLNRVMKDINKILSNDSKNLTGIVFDKDDLAELLNLGDKEVGRLLSQLFLMIQTLVNIKKFKDPDAENVLYTPKRISQNVVAVNKTNSSAFDMKMSIYEVGTPE